MLQEANKIGCRSFVSATDVVQGNYKLNLAFVANLFNMFPALDHGDGLDFDLASIHEETREEKSKKISGFVMFGLYRSKTGIATIENNLVSAFWW